MDGRGRGRARGRGRGEQQQQQKGVPAPAADAPPRAPEPAAQPRPGLPLQQQQQQHGMGAPRWAQPQQSGPLSVALAATGSAQVLHGGGNAVMEPGGGRGRAAHRGVVRPGASMEQLQAGVAGIALAEAMGGRPRRGALLFRSEPRTRPDAAVNKKGTTGTPVTLSTNMFQLLLGQQFHLCQFHVDFSPEISSIRIRKGIVYSLKELLGPISIFDGTLLFLPFRLELNPTEVYAKCGSDDVKVTISFTSEVPTTSPMRLQLYNIIFKKVLGHIGLQLIGRNYYNPHRTERIPQHRLEVWPGFESSIVQFEAGPMLSVDVSHKILSMATVYDVIEECFHNCPQGRLEDRVRARLIGQRVLTRYNKKAYCVDDIDFSRRPSSTFEKRDGSTVSFVDYYRTAYDIQLQRPDQPLLISLPKRRDERAGQKGPICLIPELCTITGLEEGVRSDRNVMTELAKHTRLDPNRRVAQYKDLRHKIQLNKEAMQDLSNWNIGFSNEIVQLQGRRLPPEKLCQGGAKFDAGDQADWTSAMRSLAMQSKVPLSTWIVAYPKKNSAMAYDLIKFLGEVAKGLGLEMTTPIHIPLNDDNTQTYKNALLQEITPHTRMVVCILPTNRKDRYDAIKCRLCCDIPVPSQMVLARTLTGQKNKLMSVATKILIQINVKMGGEVWHVQIPRMEHTMVVGIDTYHDSSKRGRSVAGVTATYNEALTRYYTTWSFQNTHEELVNGLTASLAKCLHKYREVNGCLPKRVIVYRDGVGDGQLSMVNEYELPQILQCFRNMDPTDNPSLGFVVVKKRISARFFMQQRNNYQNPPPGTIIDDVATRPEWYDFFVASQSVRQGTVTLTHYNIIHDTTGLTPDRYQRLTYKLCHLYYNWSGTIRVPAPCQYAHKVAFLVGQSLHRSPGEALADKLFYL